MLYKNKITNEVRDFSCELISVTWERAGEHPSPENAVQDKSPKKNRKKKVVDDDELRND